MPPKYLVFIVLTHLILISAQSSSNPYCGRPPGSVRNIPSIESSIPDDAPIPILRQLQIYMRHGDRMINKNGICWVNDTAIYNCTLTQSGTPNPNPTENQTSLPRLYRTKYMEGRNYWPGNCQLGQLTQNGYQQQMDNGKSIRHQYIDLVPFLSKSLNTSELFIRSDNAPRTIQSAQSFLKGLYPDESDAIDSRIINFYSMDHIMDDITPNSNICPLLSQYNTDSLLTPEVGLHNTTVLDPLLQELSPVLGIPANNIQMSHLYDCLNVHICHDLYVPPQILAFYPQVQAERIYSENASYNYPNSTAYGLTSNGFLIQEMYGFFESIVNGSATDPRFILWSSHDTAVMPFLSAFGVWNHQWCPYAAMLIMELYEYSVYSSGWAIRYIFNDEVLVLPGCNGKELCDWDDYQNIVQNLIPYDPSVQCAMTH